MNAHRENSGTLDDSPQATVRRLLGATNAHQIDALVDCFAEDYLNETPAHPERGFAGREQVRRNWSAIFTAVPDIRCEILGSVADAGTVWTEWQMSGTKPDGSPHLMRGVIIFGVTAGRISRARFYLEPVTAGGPIDRAVRSHVGAS